MGCDHCNFQRRKDWRYQGVSLHHVLVGRRRNCRTVNIIVVELRDIRVPLCLTLAFNTCLAAQRVKFRCIDRLWDIKQLQRLQSLVWLEYGSFRFVFLRCTSLASGSVLEYPCLVQRYHAIPQTHVMSLVYGTHWHDVNLRLRHALRHHLTSPVTSIRWRHRGHLVHIT